MQGGYAVNKIVRLKLGIDPKRLTRLDASSEEAITYLKKKLVEEANEVLEAKTRKEEAEELGDLIEVIYSLYAAGFDKEYVDALRTIKCEEKGDFVEFSPAHYEGSVYVLDKE